MPKYLKWSMDRLVQAICNRLLNRFDVFLIIEGKRGLGKSTFGYKLAQRVKHEMKKRGVVGYKFSPRRDLLYQREDVLKFFHKRQHTAMADEMINVSFNRDFYNEQQKDLIKMINMNRDHNNFFIACVPQFKNLDSQIKNLCSMKVTVIRRGLAIIHMPNHTVYSSDIWDEKINEKIEREWLKGGVSNPKYARLTTFRGYISFPKLTDKQENIYQQIKDDKRNIIAQGKGLDDGVDRTPFGVIYSALTDGKIKNQAMFDGMIMAGGVKPATMSRKILKQLREDGKPSKIKIYFKDDTITVADVQKQKKKNALRELIEEVQRR